MTIEVFDVARVKDAGPFSQNGPNHCRELKAIRVGGQIKSL